MYREQTVWNGAERIPMKETKASFPARMRPAPRLEPLVDTGEFRSWYIEKFGRDPVTQVPVGQESVGRN